MHLVTMHLGLGGVPLLLVVHIAHSVRKDSPFLPVACRGSTMHFVPGQWGKTVAPESSWAMELTLLLMPGRRG